MRLLLDEMYPGRLADQLREHGHDVIAVVERPELVGRPDRVMAEWARAHQRAVVTENVADFAALSLDEHAGLLLVNARRWPRSEGGVARLADALHSWSEDQSRSGSVHWL